MKQQYRIEIVITDGILAASYKDGALSPVPLNKELLEEHVPSINAAALQSVEALKEEINQLNLNHQEEINQLTNKLTS
jgi:hypothetical protein